MPERPLEVKFGMLGIPLFPVDHSCSLKAYAMKNVRIVLVSLSIIILAACSSSADETGTQTSVTEVQPNPFVSSEYVNGDEISALLMEAGRQRGFPESLISASTELPEDEARNLAFHFLADSRVLFVSTDPDTQSNSVEFVTDYCDNLTTIKRYPFGSYVDRSVSVFPYLEGEVQPWNVGHGKSTNWNEPYVGKTQVNKHIFVSEGIDGLDLPQIVNSSDGRQVNIGRQIFVFDLPDCSDPTPILEIGSDEWELLGLSRMHEIPAGTLATDPQMGPVERIRVANEEFSNLATFNNLNGWPELYFCDDHRGVELHPGSPGLRDVFVWSIEDASDIATNAIWIVYAYENSDFVRRQLLVADEEHLNDPVRGVVAAEMTECSVEQGIEYVNTFYDDLEWTQQE